MGQWLKKLDIPVKSPAGAVDNYVYRLKYGRADSMAMAVMALYSGNPMALMALSQMNNSMMGSMMGNMAPGVGGAAWAATAAGIRRLWAAWAAMAADRRLWAAWGATAAAGYGGMGGYGGSGATAAWAAMAAHEWRHRRIPAAMSPFASAGEPLAADGHRAATGDSADQTGTYLGAPGHGRPNYRGPHIIPNPFDNTLLVQSTPEEWEQISRLLAQLDVPPRQILVEAKIFEVTLTGDLQYGVESYLQARERRSPAVSPRPDTPAAFSGGLEHRR